MFSARSILSLGVFAVITAFPVSAHAGLIAIVADWFNHEQYVAEHVTTTENSQTMPLLAAALNNDPNPSKGGGDITIVDNNALLPDSGPLGTIADVSRKNPTSDEISVYVVKRGDTVSQIAEMFGVSPETVMWANDIRKGTALQEGATLVILPISGVRYAVQKGDTLASIAKKFKGDAHEIRDFNGLADNSALAVGDTIIIPDGEVGIPATPAKQFSSGASKARGGGGPSILGYFIRPTAGHKTQGIHGYNGIDIGGAVGTQVVAAAAGNVIVARMDGWNGGYGKYIVISHGNGTQTLYAHLSNVAVSTGTFVEQGQIVGHIGNTGRSTGPHLHFEVRGAKNPF